MPTDDTNQTSEQLVELLVYAPVGIALEAVDNFPKFVERGKSQVTLARFFAKTVARQGSKSVESVAERVLNDAAQVVVDLFGIDLAPDADASNARHADSPAKAAAIQTVARASSSDVLDDMIADYDTLSAREIITKLESLSEQQLTSVAAYEAQGRKRVTIQRKIDQLLTR